MRIIYFSTGVQSLPILYTLLKTPNIDVAAVVTKPDKHVREHLLVNGIKEFALTHKITVITPESLSQNKDLSKQLAGLNAEVLVSAHYAYLIPQEILAIPKYGGLNLHFSLLPAYPGPAPLEWAILNKEQVVGISLIKMSPRFDTGEIVHQEPIVINPEETAGALYERLFALAANLLPPVLINYVSGKLKPTPQSPATAHQLGALDTQTYACKITKEEARIDWSKSDPEIARIIRAFTPRPGAWTTLPELTKRYAGKRDTLKQAPSEEKTVKILKTHLQEGKLVIDTVQVTGKKPISGDDFIRGYVKSNQQG